MGTNYRQIPVNEPKVEVNSYSKDGAMRIKNATDPVYAPNSYGGPQADPARAAEVRWHADGDMVRAAYTLHPEDDDWVRPAPWSARCSMTRRGSLGAQHHRHVSKGVKEPVLSRVFEYWRNVDPDLGKKVEEGIRAQ